MQRHELEHLIRAAAAITNQYEIVVVGSQSILGAVPDRVRRRSTRNPWIPRQARDDICRCRPCGG